MSKWDHRPWRKAYTREEGSFVRLPVFTRAFARQLADSVCDGFGRIHVGSEEPASAIARITAAHRGEVIGIRRHLQLLLDDGFIVREGAYLVIPNFEVAQRRRRKGESGAPELPPPPASTSRPSAKVRMELGEGSDGVGMRFGEGSAEVQQGFGGGSDEVGRTFEGLNRWNHSTPNAPESASMSLIRLEEKRIDQSRTEGAPTDPPSGQSEAQTSGTFAVAKRPIDPPDQTDPEADDPPKLTAEQKYQRAYSAGVARAKGSPFLFPTTKAAVGALNSSLGIFAIGPDQTPLRGASLLAWIESSAEAFVRESIAKEDQPQFVSNYSPVGFVAWLNGRTAKSQPRSAQHTQPSLLDVLPEPAPKTIAPEPEAPEAETLDEMLGDGAGWKLGGRAAS